MYLQSQCQATRCYLDAGLIGLTSQNLETSEALVAMRNILASIHTACHYCPRVDEMPQELCICQQVIDVFSLSFRRGDIAYSCCHPLIFIHILEVIYSNVY